MIRVTSYGNDFKVEPVDGRNILSLVNDKVKIPELDGIPFQCQAGTCKRCVVHVEEGHEYLAPPNEIEKRALGARLENGYRLACQASATQQKKYLRQKLIQQRQTLSAESRNTFDQAIVELCLSHNAIKEAKSIMVYLDIRGEVGTHHLINRLWELGKNVYLPVTDPARKEMIPVKFTDFQQLRKGAYGILEPIRSSQDFADEDVFHSIDVVIVPGVAFRTDGGRIGYGEGYYDRFFAKQIKQLVKIGLAYPFQMNETFAVEDHDIMMDFVITPKKVYRNKW